MLLFGSKLKGIDVTYNDYHLVFVGVALKHLVTGEQTEGQFSAHIVKVNPGGILDEHFHDGKTEMHEVMAYVGKQTLAKHYCLLSSTSIHSSGTSFTDFMSNSPHFFDMDCKSLCSNR